MEERESRDVMVVATEMMRRFGAEALAKVDSWSRINRQAGESEAASFWAAVAQTIQQRQDRNLPPRANGN